MNSDIRFDAALFRSGDHVLFREVVQSFSPRLLPILMGYATDSDDANDMLQDVWRRAYAKCSSYSGRGSLLGWLIAIARSIGLDTVRSGESRRRFSPDPEFHMSQSEPLPSDAAERKALSAAIRKALVELPDRERDVVILRMLQQLSTRETAARLGCAEGTVKASLHSALKKLRAPMEVWTQ